MAGFVDTAIALGTLYAEKQKVFADAMAEWAEAANAYLIDRTALVGGLADYCKKFAVSPAPTIDVQRAAYGEQVIAGLATQLGADYGGGFGKRNLFNMLRFVEAFPDERIVHALRAQLFWTHFKAIIYFGDPLKRDFYAEMCRIERWSTRTLQERIDSMLFERTALSKQPEKPSADQNFPVQLETKDTMRSVATV